MVLVRHTGIGLAYFFLMNQNVTKINKDLYHQDKQNDIKTLVWHPFRHRRKKLLNANRLMVYFGVLRAMFQRVMR